MLKVDFRFVLASLCLCLVSPVAFVKPIYLGFVYESQKNVRIFLRICPCCFFIDAGKFIVKIFEGC
jgi:hypothetical protein